MWPIAKAMFPFNTVRKLEIPTQCKVSYVSVNNFKLMRQIGLPSLVRIGLEVKVVTITGELQSVLRTLLYLFTYLQKLVSKTLATRSLNALD